MAGWRPPRVAVAQLLLLLPPRARALSGRSLISMEDEKAEEQTIDPDEYLWETLPGRCCFMQNGDDCDLCNVWSDPQNFCHSSAESCETCGMSLYCPAPPPLLNANKVCKGASKVGEGCNDDLDTGLCSKRGAMASCQAACRRTAHCEMIVLFTDAMAGACVLCRNMLEHDVTEQVSTRVYAVTHLDIYPPSPPGYQQEVVKTFSVLQEPTPPPPPHPPPSPPRKPPPPLPAALGTHTDTHIECEFFDGFDYSIVGVNGAVGAATDTTADTKHHCCSKCGMRAGCTDFVFEPASKTCVLMPHVPSYNLRRGINNSTLAGSVTISRMDQHHAACHFEVGSGYAGGAIGVGKALPGKTMETKQDCCDACERDPRCSKFVFEHYGGNCQLFGPQSEKYFTFNLLSGTVDSRGGSVGDDGQLGGGGGASYHAGTSDAYDDAPADTGWSTEGGGDDLSAMNFAPPIPPSIFDLLSRPPPAPNGDPSEGGIAKRILADFSLGIGFLILIVFTLFAYLFFAQDINTLVYRFSNGRIGKRPRSLLPTQEPVDSLEPQHSSESKKGKGLAPGWAKVTVQTSQVTQKKEIEVAHCETLEELRELVWDEFGHLLKTVKQKDMVLLAWAANDARWELVTAASDMSQLSACTAVKLAEKKALDVKSMAVAFTSALTDGAAKRRGGDARLGLKEDHGNGTQRRDDGDESETESEGDSAPLVSNKERAKERSSRPSRARGRNERKAGRNAKEAAERVGNGTGGGRRAVGATTRRAADKEEEEEEQEQEQEQEQEEEEDVADLVPKKGQIVGSKSLVGKRVEVHSLIAMAELNGRKGVAASFDEAKGRYRVRLEARGKGEAEKVLGFKPENLRAVAGTRRVAVPPVPASSESCKPSW